MAVLVGKPAPDFRCPAVLGDGAMVDAFHLADTIRGQYALLFFYPQDFSSHFASELIELDQRMPAFAARGIQVVSVSVDSHNTHQAWRNTPVAKGGIGPVQFTMAADITREITRLYDVGSDSGMAYRGAFVIDRRGMVRSQVVNDMPLDRNLDDLLRLFDALHS